MAVYKAIPERFARIHPKYLTPTWSTIGMGVISAAFYLIFTLISTNLLSALIGSIGLMIAFYYGLTGFACVWFYRRTLFASAKNFLLRGLFPFLGGAMLLAIFFYGLISFAAPDWLTDDNGNNVTILGIGAQAVVGVGGLLIGAVLMLIWRWRKPDFFQGKTLTKQSADLVLAGVGGRDPLLGLPDSGVEAIVISPDLSNLPAGQRAVRADGTHAARASGDVPKGDDSEK